MDNFQEKMNVQNRTNQSKEQTKKQHDRSIQIINIMLNKNHDASTYPWSFCNYKNPLKHLTDFKKLGSKILQPHMNIIIFQY